MVSPLVYDPSSSPSLAMVTPTSEWNVGQVVVFYYTSAWIVRAGSCTRILMLLFLLLICNLLISVLLLCLRPSSLRRSLRAVPRLSHTPRSSVGSVGLTSPATCTASQQAVCPSVLFLASATIMSTTYTPSRSRSHSMSFVILFSICDPDVSNTTLFSSSRLTQAPW